MENQGRLEGDELHQMEMEGAPASTETLRRQQKGTDKKKFTPSKKPEEKSAVPVLKWSNSNNSNKLKNGAGIRRKAPAQRKAPALRKWRQNQENASGTSKDSYRRGEKS